MKVELTQLKGFYGVWPQAVAIIGAGQNLMPAAWHMPISADPPLYGVSVSPKRHTYALLARETGFTVNFLTHDQAGLIAKLGSTSGRDMDKLERFGLEAEPAARASGVILRASYAAFECEKFAVHECGDHFLIVGRVLTLHVAREALDKAGALDPGQIRPALYFGKDRYVTIDPDTLSIHKG